MANPQFGKSSQALTRPVLPISSFGGPVLGYGWRDWESGVVLQGGPTCMFKLPIWPCRTSSERRQLRSSVARWPRPTTAIVVHARTRVTGLSGDKKRMQPFLATTGNDPRSAFSPKKHAAQQLSSRCNSSAARHETKQTASDAIS